LREEYESEITKLRQDCEKLKQDYGFKLILEYYHGYKNGRNSIKSIVFNQCEVKCPENVLKALED
jgi:hypothetical protein